MEEDIKEIEDILKNKDTKFWIGTNGIQAIENLINGYRELEEYIKRLDELNARDFVFKSEIQEKIEELEKENEETYKKFLASDRTDENLSTKGKMLEGSIQVLQELMEEK